MSVHYSTLAEIEIKKFKELGQKYTKLEPLMKAQMKLYNDPQHRFIL